MRIILIPALRLFGQLRNQDQCGDISKFPIEQEARKPVIDGQIDIISASMRTVKKYDHRNRFPDICRHIKRIWNGLIVHFKLPDDNALPKPCPIYAQPPGVYIIPGIFLS